MKAVWNEDDDLENELQDFIFFCLGGNYLGDFFYAARFDAMKSLGFSDSRMGVAWSGQDCVYNR